MKNLLAMSSKVNQGLPLNLFLLRKLHEANWSDGSVSPDTSWEKFPSVNLIG